jgi:hypothetical protein
METLWRFTGDVMFFYIYNGDLMGLFMDTVFNNSLCFFFMEH